MPSLVINLYSRSVFYVYKYVEEASFVQEIGEHIASALHTHARARIHKDIF